MTSSENQNMKRNNMLKSKKSDTKTNNKNNNKNNTNNNNNINNANSKGVKKNKKKPAPVADVKRTFSLFKTPTKDAKDAVKTSNGSDKDKDKISSVSNQESKRKLDTKGGKREKVLDTIVKKVKTGSKAAYKLNESVPLDESGAVFNSAFSFDIEDEASRPINIFNSNQSSKALTAASTPAMEEKLALRQKFEEKIAKMAEKKKNYLNGERQQQQQQEESESETEVVEDDEEEKVEDESDKSSNDESSNDEGESYFDNSGKILEEGEVSKMTFEDLGLSRALLKGVNSLGFTRPTRIQASTIPWALQGRDICGGAVTGSGKTLAFLLPVLERLQYRVKSVAASRVLVLLPTRELAVQCYEVAEKLAGFSDVSVTLIAGGLPMRPQESALRQRPDIIIATPGRLIDHLENTPQFTLESIEILVLDEADRMLEAGFEAELERIVAGCPTSSGGRQTLLFSASMTENVEDLVRLAMRQPIKLFVDAQGALAKNLSQEFVRIRESRDSESDRLAILLALCSRSFHEGCIIFVPTKQLAHKLRVILGLAGLAAGELHGDLSQVERTAALEQFKRAQIAYLVCTDVAARGLDIPGVKGVLNYAMPTDYRQYLHRVGRTARAGKSGRSVTLVGESDRKTLKLVLKNASIAPKQRLIDPLVIEEFRERLSAMHVDIQTLLEEEKAERALMKAENEATRAQNLIQHANEIKARPKKGWFQSSQQKSDSKKKELRKN